MKKIYYLLALLLPLAFTACQKQPNLVPATITQTMNLTLATSDYQLLPSADYPHTSLSFNSFTDANTFIPVILNARDPQLGNGSTANVTFNMGTPTVKVADSLYKDLTYTVTSADYTAITGNNYGDFEASDVLKFLVYKYPTPAPNQLAILTYVLYTGTDNTVTNSFLYLNGAWMKIYQVSNAQYASVGEGKYDELTSTDLSNLPGYFNFFLKNDVTIMDTAKAKDVEYISYNYYASKDYQKVMALTFDGTNWGNISVPVTLPFVKSGGTWIKDPTVYYTLTTADTQLIGNPNGTNNQTIGTAAERANLYKYGDFSGWSATDLDNALILVLTTDFPNPKVNINYKVTYLNYTGTDVPTVVTFQYNGTAWKVQP
jgi:hypothetical protein